MTVSLDTNVLVYAIDTESEKSEQAVRLLSRSDLKLSCQVLGEFYRATTSARQAVPLTHSDAEDWVQIWMRHTICPIRSTDVTQALELVSQYKIHYFDALIIAVAKTNGCGTLYSEDLSHEQDYSGVVVLNPFN